MRALSRYDISHDAETDKAVIHWSTNDNLDWSEPTEPAADTYEFKHLADALRFTGGGCRFGWAGAVVLVTLNGDYIDRNGQLLSEEDADYYKAAPFAVEEFDI